MTFATFVDGIIWYINGLIVPLIFMLALAAFLWGVFLYIFYYESKIAEARNIIFGGVVTLAIMVSVWGILAILKNSILDDSGSSYSGMGGNSGGASGPEYRSLWDSISGIFGSGDSPQFEDCGSECNPSPN